MDHFLVSLSVCLSSRLFFDGEKPVPEKKGLLNIISFFIFFILLNNGTGAWSL